ncbi:MAG: glycosyltransferase [Flavobacteriales bacterium]|jgi:glycosyltransferase involved in cell wall biosynthesis|nr:glycosyltransferase [Flavobacteriales bacterium]
MLSIIIPTYNEEKYLPTLLESIKDQDFKDYEIIVADNNSKDNTRQIAKKFSCRIIKGGLQSIGINNAAKVAENNILLILDADASLPKGFLKKNLTVFRGKNLDVASCYIKPRNAKIIDEITHMLSNLYYFSIKRISPFIPSFCFFIKREFFFKVGCFDEKIPWLIDLAFSNNLPKETKNDILPVHVELSIRMAYRLGRFKQTKLMFLAGFLRLLKKNYYGKYEY